MLGQLDDTRHKDSLIYYLSKKFTSTGGATTSIINVILYHTPLIRSKPLPLFIREVNLMKNIAKWLI